MERFRLILRVIAQRARVDGPGLPPAGDEVGAQQILPALRDETKAGHVDSWLDADGDVAVEWTYAPSTDPSTAEVLT